MKNDDELIAKMRGFNRFYTNFIGVVDRHILDSPHSLTEARVLYEISHMEDCSARKIMAHLEIDEGYLSRMIARFTRRGLVKRSRSKHDARRSIIVLTEKGKKEFAKLDRSSSESISRAVGKLSDEEFHELVDLMDRIQALLSKG